MGYRDIAFAIEFGWGCMRHMIKVKFSQGFANLQDHENFMKISLLKFSWGITGCWVKLCSQISPVPIGQVAMRLQGKLSGR
jgi:hypothetical protein